MEAFALPRSTDNEKSSRKASIEEATKYAINVPLKVMETAIEGFGLIRQMVAEGNPNSVTDGAVGALALRSCVKGAFLNVRINTSGLDDKKFVDSVVKKGAGLEKKAEMMEAEILKLVESKI
jgi:glutamate formiminotransferase/formiminotetrahydrofolate cyclodeaminase